MMRRRYQRGHVFLRGKKGQRVWVGRYLEGVSENGKRIETGLRIGEVLALRFKNVDVEGQILSVESSAWEGKTNTPKTKTGIRRIPLSYSLTSRLSVLSQKKCSDCFIFSSKWGTPLRPNNMLRRHHYPLLDRLRIPRGGFHAFRHASASFMDQLNVPMVIRQKRLGHADIATTMKYTHSVSEEERRVNEQLGKYLSLDLGLDFNPSFPKLPSSAARN